MVLEKTLERPLDSKEIQLVHPRGISLEYSLEGLMLKLKLQYSGHLIQRADSLEKSLMLEKIEGKRKRDNITKLYTFFYLAYPFISLAKHKTVCRY